MRSSSNPFRLIAVSIIAHTFPVSLRVPGATIRIRGDPPTTSDGRPVVSDLHTAARLSVIWRTSRRSSRIGSLFLPPGSNVVVA